MVILVKRLLFETSFQLGCLSINLTLTVIGQMAEETIFQKLVLTGASYYEQQFKHTGHPRAETQIETIREGPISCTFGPHIL